MCTDARPAAINAAMCCMHTQWIASSENAAQANEKKHNEMGENRLAATRTATTTTTYQQNAVNCCSKIYTCIIASNNGIIRGNQNASNERYKNC